MAKKPDAKPPVASALRADFSGHRPDATPRPTQRPSALVDTRVIYCGDNLEQLKKLPDVCIGVRQYTSTNTAASDEATAKYAEYAKREMLREKSF